MSYATTCRFQVRSEKFEGQIHSVGGRVNSKSGVIAFLATKIVLKVTYIPGVSKKYTSLKSKIFVLITDQSVTLVSFVRQVLSLDFDT